LRAAEANRQSVPKIIHQIWVGPKPVPVTVDIWRSYCKKLGYAYFLWQERDLQEIGVYENGPFQDFMAKRSYPAAVDVARYMVIERFGGIYLDCDFIPCTDLYALHDILPMVGYSALSARTCRQIGNAGFFLLNGFIAAPPRHPVFSTAIMRLEAALKLLPKSPPWWIPGPAYLTAISKGSVTVINPSIWVAAGKVQRSLDETLRMAKAAAESRGAALMGWKPWRTSTT
jgi:mannosyltransferase OCH1-like enzyme